MSRLVSSAHRVTTNNILERSAKLAFDFVFSQSNQTAMKTTTKNVKAATKGQKQIAEENKETLSFYRNMALAANAVWLIVALVFTSLSSFDITLLVLAVAIYTGSYQFMVHMAKAKSSEAESAGFDLNMEGGIAEHVKDIIILTTACQVLSLYSNYFWLLWLTAPGRGLWLLWKHILSPYFFQQQAPENPEVDEKKQKKMDRKLKRQNR